MKKLKTIAWFSCGATSAVACKMALEKYKDVEIYYIETGSHHEDNRRFKYECEEWFNHDIITLQSSKFSCVADVLRMGFINSPYGAACTKELKKEVRYKLERKLGDWLGQVWGFDYCEKEINRAIRFSEQYSYTKPKYPLIEEKITKEMAMGMLLQAGIKLPKMYELGYHNNNCIGCPKGGMGYWNKVRVDFPDKFKEVAKIEREIGHTCLMEKVKEKEEKQPLYLDELKPNRGHYPKELVPDCGLFCSVEFADVIDKRVSKIMSGEMSIADL